MRNHSAVRKKCQKSGKPRTQKSDLSVPKVPNITKNSTCPWFMVPWRCQPCLLPVISHVIPFFWVFFFFSSGNNCRLRKQNKDPFLWNLVLDIMVWCLWEQIMVALAHKKMGLLWVKNKDSMTNFWTCVLILLK